MATGLAWAALAVTAYSSVQQYEAGEESKRQASKQSAAQKESIAAQGRLADVEAQRARIAQERESRVRRAQVLASSTGLGASSSGVAGAVSSIGSQTASNIGGIGQQQTFTGMASAANQRAADAGSKMAEAQATGQQWGAIGSLSGTIFSNAGGFNTIFGTPVKKAQ